MVVADAAAAVAGKEVRGQWTEDSPQMMEPFLDDFFARRKLIIGGGNSVVAENSEIPNWSRKSSLPTGPETKVRHFGRQVFSSWVRVCRGLASAFVARLFFFSLPAEVEV